MKKMLLAILSCLYLLVTSGMHVQQHYCMGKLRSSSVGFQEAKTCGSCGMEVGNSHCCHDEAQWLKMDDDHQAAFALGYVPAPFAMDLPPVQFYFKQPIFSVAPQIRVSNHSPPLVLPDRTVLYSVFRI
jgi:hypothetical protein